MTNAEKFEEVFGERVNPDCCGLFQGHKCKDCCIDYRDHRNDCKYAHWWEREYEDRNKGEEE